MTGSLSLIREDVEKRAPTRVMNAFGERWFFTIPATFKSSTQMRLYCSA